MAGLNGTGPEGRGPLTGRGLGRCNTEKECQTYGLGRGCGNGRKFLRNKGAGRGIWNVDSPDDEIQTLKNRIAELENKLK